MPLLTDIAASKRKNIGRYADLVTEVSEVNEEDPDFPRQRQLETP